MMRTRGIVAALVICVAMLAVAPAALANTTQDAYCNGCDPVHHQQIPFTGLDIALVVAAGGALLAAGFGVRRMGRSNTT
jgi:Mn2+/Fe2+ NRAMP family transporter